MTHPVDFFFDIGSPYSYLAATQMADLASRTGAEVRWKPFLLGAVFKATGNHMPAAVQAKAAWMLNDLQSWAEHYGVPFVMSSHFPINSLVPQRALVACETLDAAKIPDFALALFDDYWAQDVDVSKPEAVAAAATRVGLDADRILAMTAEQPVKDRLRAITEEAVGRGAFGAPTFFVGEHMFWGNDRLHFVETAVLDS